MSAFRDRKTVAERLHNNPAQAAALLEGVLTDEQVATLEATLFPNPTSEERKAALERARQVLLRAGVASDDAAVTALDDEIAKAIAE